MAVWYAVDGDVRFLSHRDTIRLWQRALTRAEAGVSFSQGFNPHMRLSLALPRSVGMASRVELLVMEMRESWSPEKLVPALQGKLPEGLDIREARAIPAKLKPHPSWVRYQIHLCAHVDREQISQRLQQFDEASNRSVHRPRRGRHPARTIDLKPLVTELALNGNGLYCTLDLSKQITARLDEVMEILKINSPNLVTRVERISVGYPEELSLKN